MRRFLFTLIAVVACSSGGTGSSGSSAPRPARGSSDFISEEEIRAGSYQTALDIIENLRPTMTRPRGSTLSRNDGASGISSGQVSSVNVVVYLDEVRLGEVQSLRTVPAQTVKEIRYINARDATTRWGTGHSSGVIQVTTRRF
jgi:hypothetical protein